LSISRIGHLAPTPKLSLRGRFEIVSEVKEYPEYGTNQC
jgi:hypothetical protein